jgi:ligand-binding SRPBCC domain-containing protein
MLRTGVVLGRDGGALAMMLPAFRVGLGGRLGSGRQYIPWIHIRDFVRIVAMALADGRYGGAINAVAPEPVTSREFAKTLGRTLGPPAVMPIPAAGLRAVFGDAASVLLGSQRCEPQALRRLGFPFAFETVSAALADVVGGAPVTIVPGANPGAAARPSAFELRTTTTVNAPLEETFAFFSRAENLGMLTPASMRFSIAGPAPTIAEGATIDYTLRIGPLPITWRSRIVSWVPHVRFIDVQEAGPYRTWWHEHTFRASGSATVMEDRVCYTPPLGVVGRLANQLFIVPALRQIFQYRADVIRLRFGGT